MAVVDLSKIELDFTFRKKLLRDLTIYPLAPEKGGGYELTLLPGVYQMRPRPGGKICVRSKFYQPSNQSQPNKVARQLIFADAILAWRALPADEVERFRLKAFGKHMSGYNVFMHEYLTTH
jgi:hypothetical protein